MEKRTLLALALSALVFIVYYGVLYRPPEPAQTTSGSTPDSSPPENKSPPPVSSPSSSSLGPESLPSQVSALPEVTRAMETEVVRSEVSSKHGLPLAWLLKKYFSRPGKQGDLIDLLQGNPDDFSLALSLGSDRPVAPHFAVEAQTPKQIVYRGKIGELELRQQIDYAVRDYTLQLKLEVENLGAQVETLSPGLRLHVKQSPPGKKGFLFFKEASDFKFPVYRVGTKVKRQRQVEKLGALQEESGDIAWAGLEDHYFLRLILAQKVSSKNLVSYGQKEGSVFTEFRYASEPLAPRQKKEYVFTLYLGPKDPGLLASFGKDVQLDKAIDYGWFSFVALPILSLLKIFHSLLANWGLAIIALTLLIKLLLHPLTRKSMQSMKAMQGLQPQLQKIREKYKDDKEKLNLETMSLFRAHKVNPMGGCLPMVVQMPIYIALYKVLYNATDLYHAPFFGFYQDLSAPDPYYILPILLGLLMVLQQKMTPNPSADPAQAKIMMLMPVFFSLFMLFLPLGLVIYIFVNTGLTVLQQWMNRKNYSLFRRASG